MNYFILNIYNFESFKHVLENSTNNMKRLSIRGLDADQGEKLMAGPRRLARSADHRFLPETFETTYNFKIEF